MEISVWNEPETFLSSFIGNMIFNNTNRIYPWEKVNLSSKCHNFSIFRDSSLKGTFNPSVGYLTLMKFLNFLIPMTVTNAALHANNGCTVKDDRETRTTYNIQYIQYIIQRIIYNIYNKR